MRGGRNKFGPMYKRDRARKLQLLRQRQIATGNGRGGALLAGSSDSGLSYSPNAGYSPASSASSLHIKQEIQIPQVSSLTSSPDSSPSPIAAQLSGLGPSAPQMMSNCSALLAGTGTAPSAQDHKMWTAPNSTTPSPHSLSPKAFHYDLTGAAAAAASGSAVSAALGPKMSPLIRDFVQGVDDREWQNSLFGLLQNQTYNQCEVDLFELMCKVLDQNLFSQVDWARNSVFFKDLKVRF